jgi:phosphate transport system substrate-binding protein
VGRIDRLLVACILSWGVLVGCQERKPVSTTSGSLRMEVDESVVIVFKAIAESFQRSYTEAHIRIDPVEARAAIADFINDSVRVIATAREFNDEELGVLKKYPDIEWKGYKCALDAVAVIGHKNNPRKQLRLSELDSIFSGELTRWGGKGKLIDVAIGDINSSTNEVFKNKILKGKPFTPTAEKFPTSDSLIHYVQRNPNAIGIVGVNWLQAREDSLTVFSLGQPGSRPDSTEPFGRYYPPLQAHIYRQYYPLTRPVYVYSREHGYSLAAGFITYITSRFGQQLFLNQGLVPATMPVRLVETTSKQVQ